MVIEDIGMRLPMLADPVMWGIATEDLARGVQVPSGVAEILGDATVAPLWELPEFSAQRFGTDDLKSTARTPILGDEPRRSAAPLIAPPTQTPPPTQSHIAKGPAAMGSYSEAVGSAYSSGVAGSRSKVLLIAGAAGLLLAGIVGIFNTGRIEREAPGGQLPSDSAPQDLDASSRKVDDTGVGGVQRPRSRSVGDTDLNLSVPMSYPRCDGSGIVVLGNVIPPRRNWQDAAAGVQRLLEEHPGASYLRTDTACPSLRQADEAGNPIYAVFREAGRSKQEVCDAVRAAGSDAYGKWLDTATPPAYIIPC